MGRKSSDTELNALANGLRVIKFTEAPDLDAITLERFNAWGRSAECPFRFVGQMPNMKVFVVKMYLGGKKRIIGYTENLTAACRFADMAQMRLWKYRIRGASEPVDADLNFGVEQAKHDCANEEAAGELLDQIEEYLKNKGVLIESVDETERERIRKDRDVRRTVRHEVHTLHAEVMAALSVINENIKKLLDRAPELFKRTVVNHSTTMEQRLIPFEVCVPNPFKEGEIAHRVTVQVPVKVDASGTEILLPEAHAIIDDTKQREVDKLLEGATMAAAIENPQPVEVQLGVEELFSPPNKTNS